jgi:site-specific recombinase XerD
MPTIKPFVRPSARKGGGVSNIRFYISDGREVMIYYKSIVKVDYRFWDTKKNCLKAKSFMSPVERRHIEEFIIDCKKKLMIAYDNLIKNGINPTSKALCDEMQEVRIDDDEMNFFDYLKFVKNSKNISENTREYYDGLGRLFCRFEAYKRILQRSYRLDIHTFNTNTAIEFENFIKEEHNISEAYPELYNGKIIKCRGGNSIAKTLKCTRAFFNFLVKKKIIRESPYTDLECPKEVYGTPYYLTTDELNTLYKYDFSEIPKLAIQRDIFVFHCHIGCRVGDFIRLTKSNIVDGAIEYVAEKTNNNNPKTIRVPLNKIGIEILERYKNTDGNKLLPFTGIDSYNKAIKRMFTIAGLNRIVTILDTITRRDVQKPLNEVASPHLARRTLYANVYKKFKDPALAGSLTGHSPNSIAAQRYRDIDDDMKKELVSIFE